MWGVRVRFPRDSVLGFQSNASLCPQSRNSGRTRRTPWPYYGAHTQTRRIGQRGHAWSINTHSRRAVKGAGDIHTCMPRERQPPTDIWPEVNDVSNLTLLDKILRDARRLFGGPLIRLRDTLCPIYLYIEILASSSMSTCSSSYIYYEIMLIFHSHYSACVFISINYILKINFGVEWNKTCWCAIN